VNEPIKVATDLVTPWFSDNLHFRPRFGDVMLADITGAGSTQPAGILLTPDNVEDYIDTTILLQRSYIKADRRRVSLLKKNLKF
jgi:hypothetical protein